MYLDSPAHKYDLLGPTTHYKLTLHPAGRRHFEPEHFFIIGAMGQRKRSSKSRQQSSSEKRDMRSRRVIPVTTKKLVAEIKKRLKKKAASRTASAGD
jgi:hypothetical protein